MILAAAVALGLAAGLIRAWINKKSYRTVSLHFPGLVLIAFFLQWITFYQSRIGFGDIPDRWAAILLSGTQIVLLIFAWLNRRQPGFWLLIVGLLANLIVIMANGGLMPITPDMVERLYPEAPFGSWQIGERLGSGKDIVLSAKATRLWFLSDRFFLPAWPDVRVAFSLGDVLIAAGAFWLLWTSGGMQDDDSHPLPHTP
jgi:hypothetical protein